MIPRFLCVVMPVVATTLMLCACGMETAGTAAAVGVTKKQEIEQGKVTSDKLQEQLQQSTELGRQRNEALEQAGR
ncbi:MAG TPA: hypothetical protein VFW67_15375 [Burkholderiaceae bacterium]|nr:hypothetical protein [Burkholderiaceae bacterium]